MFDEFKKGDYSPIDPYKEQSPAIDNTNSLDETENEGIQIHDYSQYDYENFRYKRQPFSDSSALDALDAEQDPEPEAEPVQREPEVKELFLVPLYAITGFFAAVFIIGPFLVKQGPDRGIFQSSIMIAAFCMWIFWFTIYFGQMHPLMGPRLENTTVAWIAYKLGHSVQTSNTT